MMTQGEYESAMFEVQVKLAEAQFEKIYAEIALLKAETRFKNAQVTELERK